MLFGPKAKNAGVWDYYEFKGDGMPDAWEKAHGLDPDNAGDGSAFADNGYTNVENYLNELAGDTIAGLAQDRL